MEITKEQKQEAILDLAKMIELLGLSAEITETAGENGFEVSLKTSEPGRLIGRKGYYLESLELLLNRILRKKFQQVPWVAIDVDGYERKSRPRGRLSDDEKQRLEQMPWTPPKKSNAGGNPRESGHCRRGREG